MTTNMEFWNDGLVPPTNEYKRLPEWLQLQLTQWLIEGDPYISEFLEGVLTNDLMKACEHADPETMSNLKDLTLVVYNRLPACCWGTKDRVKAWKEVGGWNGYCIAEEKRLAAAPEAP